MAKVRGKDAHADFQQLSLIVEAAISGRGIILVWGNVMNVLVDPSVRVPMLPGFTSANQSYYVRNKRRAVWDEAKMFNRWLMAKLTISEIVESGHGLRRCSVFVGWLRILPSWCQARLTTKGFDRRKDDGLVGFA